MNEEFGLGWLSFEARFYDPAIARFPSVDPIIEDFPSHTPYNFAFNDPVGKIDLYGLQGIRPHHIRFNETINHIAVHGDQDDFNQLKVGLEQGAKANALASGIVIGVSSGPALYRYALMNPEMMHLGIGVAWGMGTDQDMPGTSSDDWVRATRNAIGDDIVSTLKGGSLWVSRYGEIAEAGSRLVYIGTKGGKPYIGKTATTITARYNKYKEAPTPFTDFFNAPEDQLVNIESALIWFNGGPKSNTIGNKKRGEGNIDEGIKWLDENLPEWRDRFNFGNTD